MSQSVSDFELLSNLINSLEESLKEIDDFRKTHTSIARSLSIAFTHLEEAQIRLDQIRLKLRERPLATHEQTKEPPSSMGKPNSL